MRDTDGADFFGADIQQRQFVEHHAAVIQAQSGVEKDVFAVPFEQKRVDGRIRLAGRHKRGNIRLFGAFEEVCGHFLLHILQRPHFDTVEIKVIDAVQNHRFLLFCGRGRFVVGFRLFVLLRLARRAQQRKDAKEVSVFFHITIFRQKYTFSLFIIHYSQITKKGIHADPLFIRITRLPIISGSRGHRARSS